MSKCLVNTQFDDFSNNTLVILSRSYYRQTIFRFFLRFLSLAVRRKLMCTITGVNYIPPVGFLFPREFARGMTPLAFLIYWFSTCFYYFTSSPAASNFAFLSSASIIVLPALIAYQQPFDPVKVDIIPTIAFPARFPP